jgi:hypothetical protein
MNDNSLFIRLGFLFVVRAFVKVIIISFALWETY